MTIYTHKPARHFAYPFRIKWHSSKALRLKINLSLDCWYDEKDQKYPGWNKIGYWFSIHPHWNGITLVWRPMSERNTFMIAYYIWKRGVSPMTVNWHKSQFKRLDGIKADKDYKYFIVAKPCDLTVDQNTSLILPPINFRPWLFLSPFFGGKSKPGKKCHIKVEVLK